EHVREGETDLHVVDPPPELERPRGVEELATEAGQPQYPWVVNPLIAQVMNGEDRGDPLKCPGVRFMSADEARNPSRLMIVRMEDVEAFIQQFQALEAGAGEEQESLGIVRESFSGVGIGIDSRPIKERPLAGMI